MILLLGIFGGGKAYSQSVFIVTAEKPKSETTTQFYVYAKDELGAAEQVTLNGWKVVDVEKVPDKGSSDETSLADSLENNIQKDSNSLKNNDNKTDNNTEKSLKRDTSDNNTNSTGTNNLVKINKTNSYPYNGNASGLDLSERKFLQKIEKSVLPKENVMNSVSPEKLAYNTSIYFKLGKYQKEFSSEEVKLLKSFDNETVVILYGHTDSVPVKNNSEKFRTNYELSLKRADFIKKSIVDFSDIKQRNVKIAGFGALFPAEDNDVNGEPLNRRVEIYEY